MRRCPKRKPSAVEIIPFSQGCTSAHLFLYLLYLYGLGDNIIGIKGHCRGGGRVRLEARSVSPTPIAANFGSGRMVNRKPKEFLEPALNRKFYKWPRAVPGFFHAALAALCYHSELVGARGKDSKTNTK